MANVLKLYTTGRGSGYSKWELIPSKLFVVDNIEEYLLSKSPLTINNFQYIKNDLEIGINVDLVQAISQPLTTFSFKYVSIQNDNELIHYYFVKKAIWRSKNCVRLELVMDVLNTFKEGTDYTFKANTKINREHKDRFIPKNYIITMNISEIISIGGTLHDNDLIDVKFMVGLEEMLACKGKILDFHAFYPENKYLTFSLNNTYDIKQALFLIRSSLSSIIVCQSLDPDESMTFKLSSATYDCSLYRNIDKTPENIVPLLVCDNTIAENVEHQTSKLQGDWYLLYRNQNDPDPDTLLNPVECYLFADTEKNVNSGVITSGKLTPTSLIDGKYYYARIQEKDSFGTELIAQSITTSTGITISKDTLGGGSVYGIYVEITKNRNNTMNVSVFRYLTGDSQVHYVASYFDLDYIQLNNLPFYYVLSNSEISYTSLYRNAIWNSESSWSNTDSYNIINPITLLDRTDAKNIKLIKLPYCPYDFTISGTMIDISSDPNWDYTYFEQANNIDFYALKLHYLDTKLEGTIEDTQFNPLDYLYFNTLGNIDKSLTHLREQANYESKLYHSEFFTPTFYYDSFAFKFELEKCDLFTIFANYTKTSVKNEIKFDMTKTINSKFMFTFKNYEVLNNDQNYSKYLPIARNNEEVLYNVPYINYIRTGYQYDVKNKNISNISNALGVGLSTGSLAVSLAMPSAPLKVAGVVASVVSMAMSVKNAVVTAVQNDNSLKQKITQYQNQTSSVAGSDDVDLMSIYAENRLQYLEYEPRAEMEKLIFDLFFYAGYRSERMGVPSHNSRINFDYLECDASIESIATIPNECLDELVNCFKNGVTYLHKTTRTTDKWDFEQKYENWEKWLLEE